MIDVSRSPRPGFSRAIHAEHRGFAWGVNPDSDSIAPNLQNRDGDIVSDRQRLRRPAGQNEHVHWLLTQLHPLRANTHYSV
jgi:hypothetical protein